MGQIWDFWTSVFSTFWIEEQQSLVSFLTENSCKLSNNQLIKCFLAQTYTDGFNPDLLEQLAYASEFVQKDWLTQRVRHRIMTTSCDDRILTLRKIAIWMSKLSKTWHFKKRTIFVNFFWKKCQVFGNFLTVKWQFSGGSGWDYTSDSDLCPLPPP